MSDPSLSSAWSLPIDRILGELDVDPERGLAESEARRRREKYGRNELRETETRSLWEILFDQFESLIVLLLVAAALVAFLFGEWVEGIAIAAVIMINAAIGFVTEWRAIRSMEALKELGGVTARVLRDGDQKEIPAEELVPGDIVLLEGGDLVTADIRLIEASKLQVDESALTGESVPVEKSVEPVDEDAPLAERESMVYKGTALTRGAGAGVVTTTGMETELGEISTLVQEAEEERTPLEERLDQLGNRLIWLTLVIAFFVTVSGVMAGRELFLMIETGIALAVATIPEGLPIVATMALARGMWRMADRNALINRLSAVETLGSTTIIFTDKTGTLTENRMTVREFRGTGGTVELKPSGNPGVSETASVDLQNSPALQEALKVGVLSNNASLTGENGESSGMGDPMEIALLEAGRAFEYERDALLEELPEEREEAFDAESKMMGTFHRTNGEYYVAVKGAPEAVIEHCTRVLTADGQETEMSEQDRTHWIEQNVNMAEHGLRVLAMARKTAGSTDEDPYQNMTFLGLVGLLDPPRSDVREALHRCHDAGIRVIMVTGDQAETARNIAREVDLVPGGQDLEVLQGSELRDPGELSEEEQQRLLKVPIYSRVSPKQKLSLIELHQKSGGVAGMTGDGVNDAPALKKADIGIAMGQRGTQVAREAADMVLTDDAFSSIVAAIEQGRVIFKNIRKFVYYLLSCNVSEILVVGLASLIRMPLPILPLQILFLNLVTDVFPALALGMGEGESQIMDEPPRDPEEPILERGHWITIGIYGIVFTGAVLGSLAWALLGLEFSSTRATTVSFLTLATAQLWHVFNMREFGTRLWRNDIVENPYVWGALGLSGGLLLIAVYLPGLARVLRVQNPGWQGWGVVLVMSLIPLVYGQLVKSFQFKIFE